MPGRIQAQKSTWLLAGLMPLIGATVGLVPPLWVATQRKREQKLAKLREGTTVGAGADRKRIALQATHAKKLRTELHAVIGRKDVARLSQLLDVFPIAALEDAQGRTPLQRAVEMNNPEMLRALVEHGVKAISEGLIDDAIISNKSTQVIRTLFAASGLRAKAVHVAIAVRRHDAALLDVLFATCADLQTRAALLNTPFKGRFTALYLACETQAPVAIAETLLENGADVNAAAGFERLTPLHRAVFAQDTDLIELLLSYGADKTVADAYGNTPLRLASYAGPVLQFMFAD